MNGQKQFKPGSYELIIRISNPIIDPGNKLQIEVYVTGYGKIESPKVAVYPSWNVFLHEKSLLSVGDSPAKPIDDAGGVIILNEESFSNTNNRYQILTECRTPGLKAPINLDMAIVRHARPGMHTMNFVLTYFDGEKWNTKYSSVHFTVRNFYQRHETFVWIIGAFAAIISISTGIITMWHKLKIILCTLFE